MEILLPRTDGAIVKGIAHRLGIGLKYQPTTETVQTLLRIALDNALAGTATAGNRAERHRWQREVIRCRVALGINGGAN
jgi:hypothetical protein